MQREVLDGFEVIPDLEAVDERIRQLVVKSVQEHFMRSAAVYAYMVLFEQENKVKLAWKDKPRLVYGPVPSSDSYPYRRLHTRCYRSASRIPIPHSQN